MSNVNQFLAFFGSLTKIGEALVVWSDPKRREVVKLRMAIESAENLFMIDKNQNEYKDMPRKRKDKWRRHWGKRWRAFKDGV